MVPRPASACFLQVCCKTVRRQRWSERSLGSPQSSPRQALIRLLYSLKVVWPCGRILGFPQIPGLPADHPGNGSVSRLLTAPEVSLNELVRLLPCYLAAECGGGRSNWREKLLRTTASNGVRSGCSRVEKLNCRSWSQVARGDIPRPHHRVQAE